MLRCDVSYPLIPEHWYKSILAESLATEKVKSLYMQLRFALSTSISESWIFPLIVTDFFP